MVLQILLHQIDFGSFLLVAVRRIIPVVFVPTATSSTMVIHTLDSPAMTTKLFSYFALTYWCWYSCRC
jgi:peptidoglycan/LPS O-acetylase OafA/YrhL